VLVLVLPWPTSDEDPMKSLRKPDILLTSSDIFALMFCTTSVKNAEPWEISLSGDFAVPENPSGASFSPADSSEATSDSGGRTTARKNHMSKRLDYRDVHVANDLHEFSPD